MFLPSRTYPQNGRRATTPVRPTHKPRSRAIAPINHQPPLLNRIARVSLCLGLIHAVIGKLTGLAGVTGAIAAEGLPLTPVLLVAALALMAVGPTQVISGCKARLGAVLLQLFLVSTT